MRYIRGVTRASWSSVMIVLLGSLPAQAMPPAADLVSAAELLVTAGLADPAGGEYREIEVLAAI